MTAVNRWVAWQDRAGWLARPWFFAAVGLLALNDQVLKAAWPGWVTGKLSDFAGVVVVATVAAVALGPMLGTMLAGLGFVALKLVPGVAEAAAGLLGGGVTLRDASDLVAVAVLPVVFWELTRQRPDQVSRTRGGWRAVGLVAAVLATTATALPAPSGGVEEIGYANAAFHARVALDHGMGERWLTSTDGGRTWSREGVPGELVSADEAGSETWTACADDGVCYRARMAKPGAARNSRSQHLVERRAVGADWVTEADLAPPPAIIGLAVNPGDSSQAVVISWADGFYRDPSGGWQELDLVEKASDPQWLRSLVVRLGSGSTTLILALLLSILGWIMLPTLSIRWLWQVLTLFVGGVAYFAGRFLFSQALILTQVHAIWAVGAIAIALVMRRRRRRVAAPETPPGPSQ